MGIERKTLGQLVDELTVANLKCWAAIDMLNHYINSGEKAKAGEQANLVHKLNQRRNALVQAIDRLMGFEEFTTTDKIYKEVK